MVGDNSFDRLTARLNTNERLALLHKIKSVSDADTQSIEESHSDDNEQVNDISISLKQENLLIRIWMFIKAVFSSSSPENMYNEYRLATIGRYIEQNYQGIINYKENTLLLGFYNNILELQSIALHFKSSIAVYEDDQGRFFAFLGTLIIPELSQEMSEKANPYTIPFDREITQELRSSMLRKMEEILQNISPDGKARLYEAVRCLEWIRQFVRLPYEKFLSRFANTIGAKKDTAPIDVAAQEIFTFAKVICNGHRIYPEVLEALYMMGADKNTFTSNNKQENDNDADIYLSKSLEKVSRLKMFINSVPLRKIGCLAARSFFWQPEQIEGIEEWFIKYKSYWKKLFDQQWENWLKDRKKEQTRQYLEVRFHMSDFPLLAHRPWSLLWGGLPFSREYSLGFTSAFFERIYPAYTPLFKTIIGEGNFIQKDNQQEFTDAYNELEQQVQLFKTLDTDLSTSGATGSLFTNLESSGIRTIQSQAKADSLMRKIESDAAITVAKFCSSCRSIQLILAGITSEKRNRTYDTLSNISTIQGRSNLEFRQQLKQTSKDLEDILELIKNLESIEISEMK